MKRSGFKEEKVIKGNDKMETGEKDGDSGSGYEESVLLTSLY